LTLPRRAVLITRIFITHQVVITLLNDFPLRFLYSVQLGDGLDLFQSQYRTDHLTKILV